MARDPTAQPIQPLLTEFSRKPHAFFVVDIMSWIIKKEVD